MIKTEKKIEKLKKNYRKRMKTKKRCNAIIGRSMAQYELLMRFTFFDTTRIHVQIFFC